MLPKGLFGDEDVEDGGELKSMGKLGRIRRVTRAGKGHGDGGTTPGNFPSWHTECLNLGVDVRWLYAGLNPTLKTVTAIITAVQRHRLVHTPSTQRRHVSPNTDAASCFSSSFYQS
jgi:hypothetical protein